MNAAERGSEFEDSDGAARPDTLELSQGVTRATPPPLPHPAFRWLQLAAGILAMIAVANFQYAWTLFVLPLSQLHKEHGWSTLAIVNSLALFFTQAQTWLVPLEGYLADRFGARRLVLVGGVFAGLGWCLIGTTDSLAVLRAAQLLAGCGSGIVYGICMGNALKWFPDRRGLAAGLTAAAFGAGSAATVEPIRRTIADLGPQLALVWFGVGQGLIIVLTGALLRFPRGHEVPRLVQAKLLQTRRDYTPAEMLRSPAFWLLYGMMTIGAVPGLLVLVQIAPMAEHFQVAQAPISIPLLGISYFALPLAMVIDRIMGGLTRPVFGWISDHIGRELAIFLAFALEGGALWLLILNVHVPVMFVVMSGLAFFGWGAIFSLFPAVSGDMFGRKFATTNYGILYTAKGAASGLVWACNTLQAHTGDWILVFTLMIAADFLAAGLALFVLRPLRRRAASAESG
jgi:OFA family oxalate/formate antiporter-like MFS transporter